MDGDTMVLETVEEGIDQWFTLEESVPVRVDEIGCNQCGSAAVAFIHESKEGVDLFGFEGEIPQFVNQKHRIAGEGLDQPLRGAVGKGSIELIEEILGIEETAAISGENGLAEQTYCESGFARAGVPYEDDILSTFHKGKAGQGLNLRPVEIGLGFEGEGLQSPVPGDLRFLEPMIETSFLPVAVLFHKKPVDHFGYGASLPLRAFDFGIQDLIDPSEFQLGKQRA